MIMRWFAMRWRRFLSRAEKINVVQQASDGQQAIAAAENCQPEVLVLDYSLPKGDGPEVIQTLQQSAPRRSDPGSHRP